MNFKPKYKVGDEFSCTLKIIEIIDDAESEEDYEYTSYNLEVVDSAGNVSLLDQSGWFDKEMMDRAFDPHYVKRKKLERIRELREELKELEDE